jgi:membrane complex biogenesis BtpA family protein
MLHLLPLPGSPRYDGNLQTVTARALDDAARLTDAGVDGLMLENFGDIPFQKSDLPPITVACLSAIAVQVRQRFPLPLGINALRNDGIGALSVACASGASFIRVNVLCGARVTDQGIIEGRAANIMRLRSQLHADVKVLADVDVKHSAPLGERPIEVEVADTLYRGLADALIVSGAGTGKPTDIEKLATVKQAAGDTPVFVGSGVTASTAAELAEHADGLIVGTSVKVDGITTNPVDPRRVRELLGVFGR